MVFNRNKNALVQQAPQQPDSAHGLAEDRENSVQLYLWRNLNYTGYVDYMISKLRRTVGSSPGAAAAMKNSGGNSHKVVLRYRVWE
jgi:hypothetical protein